VDTLLRSSSADQWAAARRLVAEYAAGLGVDLEFQGFEGELEELEAIYGPPRGAFFLAEHDGQTVGCVGVRLFDGDDCEMKRLYVAASCRGLGLGRRLAEAAIAEGRKLGYRRVLLDTLPSMAEARRLYEALGFRSIPPYRHNPVPGTAFLALELDLAD
jgi:ribosomal protein S18 acetylase RimI-like enzyme